MNLKHQAIHLVNAIPISLRHKTYKEWLWLLLYLSVGISVFGVAASLLYHYQSDIKQALLDYLFPTDWHGFSDALFGYLHDTQSKAVIANMIISGSLVLASVCLFPLKELYSASVERALKYPIGPCIPLSLTMQAIEELRLIAFYLAAQLVIVWIGYYPFQWTSIVSTTLSYLFLFYTFTLDLVSPTWQRHGVSYSKINKTLFTLLPSTLVFGVIFTLPALFIGDYLLANSDQTLLNISFVLFFVNLFFIALAIPSGTYLVCKWQSHQVALSSVSKRTKAISYGLGLVIIVFFGTLHARLLQSIHYKSQLLKANYDLHWRSFNFDFNAIFNDHEKSTFTTIEFELTISNPTAFNLEVEDSYLLFDHNGKQISRVEIVGFSVASGATKTLAMSVDITADFQSFEDINDWRDAFVNWEATWYLQLFPSIPFIVKLTE